MRTPADRIRHAVGFELSALLIATPLGALLMGRDTLEIGIVVAVSATLAMAWNYLFNWAFDHAKLRLTGSVAKSPRIRVLHAVLFEAGLSVLLIPYIAWHLSITLWQALVMDAGFILFYLVYAFVYNWLYDVVFPVPVARTDT